MIRVKQASPAFQKGDYVKSNLCANLAYTGVVCEYYPVNNIVKVKWHADVAHDPGDGTGHFGESVASFARALDVVKISKEEYEQRCLAYELQR